MSLYIENIYFLKLLVLLLTVFIVLMLLLLLLSLERQIHREKIQRKLFCLLFRSRGGYTCGSWACWGQEPETSSGNIIAPLWRKTLRTKINNRTSSNPRFSGIYNPWAFQIPMLCFSGERDRGRRERGKEKRKEKLDRMTNKCPMIIIFSCLPKASLTHLHEVDMIFCFWNKCQCQQCENVKDWK